MKLHNIILSILGIPFIFSCSSDKKKDMVFLNKGKATVTINNYIDAKSNKDFKNSHSLKTIVNFDDNVFIENVIDFNTMFYIEKDSFTLVDNISDFNHKEAMLFHLSKKPFGMSFVPSDLNGMTKTIELDTIINAKEYTFLSFENEEILKTFYLKKTDSLYSYSMSDSLERHHNAVITNINIYDKKSDLFTTIYVDYSSELDEKENMMLNFNKYIDEQ